MENRKFMYTKEFDQGFAYGGDDLGAVCGQGETVFKIWAPFADRVVLRLYGDESEPVMGQGCIGKRVCRVMEKADQGVWSLRFPENLHGTYYDYLLYDGEDATRTADPYATGCSCNGIFSMVVDHEKASPEGFSEDQAPPKPPETILYELHIKDYSYDPGSGVPKQYRGKYKAFTVQERLQYLKELGVTHVHLLPFYDFGWLDEAGSDEQFNWGYDPVNYNVPEGSFATDPHDGTVRIRECKEMIQALHNAGLRVIMDVVYNHTFEADSWLERSAPGYYYRRLEDGSLSNGSACGNDIAAGRAMVDNYILHSVLYWAEEYHLDGFRFDLMGLLTVELMNRIQQELDLRYGVGEKFLYGEPWKAADSPMEEGTHGADKDAIRLLNEKIAVFCDCTRDLIKGDVFLVEKAGFVNGGKGLEFPVLQAVTGWCSNPEKFQPLSCNQIINYVSAHDNYTLWDKLCLSMRPEQFVKQPENTMPNAVDSIDGEQFAQPSKEKDYLYPYPDVLAANKLAALMYFTCQGHLFLQAGEEFGRTKFGDENSYRSRPELNMLRWGQTEVFGDLVEYYRGLIALRKRLPGLCDKSKEATGRIRSRMVHRAGVVSFMVDNRSILNGQRTGSEEAEWSVLYIVYNASDKAYNLQREQLQERCASSWNDIQVSEKDTWEILANAEHTNCRREMTEDITIPPHSGLILGRSSKAGMK